MRLITDLTSLGPRLAFRTVNPRALFLPGDNGFWFCPQERAALFTDTAGTSPATQPGQAVARVLDLSGSGRHAVQATVAARPVLGRHPAGGIRNRAHGSGAVSNNAFWTPVNAINGITATKIATGAGWVQYAVTGLASAEATIQLYVRTNSNVQTAAGAQWTASVTARIADGTPPAAGSGARVIVREADGADNALAFSGSPAYNASAAASLSVTRTISTGVRASAIVDVRIAPGAEVNFVVEFREFQFESGPTRTAHQTNLSLFDITEPGQRDLWYLDYDGVDDVLSTGPMGWGTDTVAVLAGVHKRSDAMRGMIVESTAGSGARFFLDGPGSALKYTLGAGGSTVQVIGTGAAGFTAPHTAVLEGAARISTDTMTLSVNGAQVSSGSADQGTGTFADGSVFIGARGGASLFFNGRVYGLLAINRTLSATEQLRARRHFAHLTGVTLP